MQSHGAESTVMHDSAVHEEWNFLTHLPPQPSPTSLSAAHHRIADVDLNSLSSHHEGRVGWHAVDICSRSSQSLICEVHMYLVSGALCVWVCVSIVFLAPPEWWASWKHPGVCVSRLRGLRRGLSPHLQPEGQTQVVTIKAELLTPIPKNETAHCVATDSSHNEP